MTIKIEREALQCITNDTPLCTVSMGGEQQVDHIPESRLKDSTSYPELDLTECDDDSSVSSFSFSSSTTERSVTWANPLVTDVRYREPTKATEVKGLFYSYEQTQRFRQEYRIERRRAAEEEAASNEPKINNQDVSLNIPASTRWSLNSTRNSYAMNTNNENARAMGKHRISRVVVMHKNNLTTFVDPESPAPTADTAVSDNVNKSVESISGNTSTSNSPTFAKIATDPMTSNHFFDNDNFWSGQITWY